MRDERMPRDSRPACSLILSAAASLVPRSLRADWLEDWQSELWYICGSRSRAMRPRPDHEVLRFCLGAFKDAAWVRWDRLRAQLRQPVLLRSSLHCVLFLAAVAIVIALPFFYEPQLFDALIHARGFLAGECWMAAMALTVVPATISLARGYYPVASRSRTGTARLRRWSFLSAKFALLIAIESSVLGYVALFPNGQVLLADIAMVGYVLVFRWALMDQRRRCPVCLRLLTCGAAIGQPSRIFLECGDAEYCCPRGHGSLRIPEVQTTFTQRGWRESTPPPLTP